MASDEGLSGLETHKPFRLLDLPPELWSRICKLAVVSEGHVCLLDRTLEWHQPPITRVCRAVRAECLPHFYTSNVFYAQPDLHSHWTRLARCLSHLWRYDHPSSFLKVYLFSLGGNIDSYMNQYLEGMSWREVSDQDAADWEVLRAKEDWVMYWRAVRVLLNEEASSS